MGWMGVIISRGEVEIKYDETVREIKRVDLSYARIRLGRKEGLAVGFLVVWKMGGVMGC